MSQTGNNCQEAKSQQIEKMLQRMAVLPFILYIRIKGEDVRAQWDGHCPTNQNVAGLIPGQGTRLGCGVSPH